MCTVPAGVDVTLGGETVLLYISDVQNGYVVNGTSIGVVADNCKISGDGSYTVGNTNRAGFTVISLNLGEDDAADGVTNGAITITAISSLTASGGAGFEVESQVSFSCTDTN